LIRPPREPLLDRLSGPALFAALLVLLRVAFLLGAMDPAQERAMSLVESAARPGGTLPERPLYDREELYTNTAAQAMRMDLGLPAEIYRFMPYGSGSLLIACVAMPVQGLLGSGYLAFKLIPLLITVAGPLFWLLVVRRWLGRRAAALFGLLYILAPTLLVRTALIAKGDHAEAMALLGAVGWLGTRAVQAGGERARRLWAAATGALAGLALYVTYSAAPVLAAGAAAVLIRARGRPRRAWLAFGAGLAAGLLPWFIHLGATGGRSLLIYGRAPGSAVDLAEAGGRLVRLAGSGLMAGYDMPSAILPALAGLVWLLAVAGGAWTLLRGGGRAGRSSEHRAGGAFAAAILAAAGAHIAAFCLLAPDGSSRYIVPAYPLFLIAALGAPRRAILIAVAAAGIAAQAWAVGDVRFAALRGPASGVDWPLLGEIAGAKLERPAIASLPPDVRPHFEIGHGRRLFRTLRPEAWPESAAAAGTEGEPHVWEGIGGAWCETHALWEAARYLPALGEAQRAALRRGLLRYADLVFASALAREGPAVVPAIARAFAPEDRPAMLEALARALAALAVHRGRIAEAARPGAPEGGASGAGDRAPIPAPGGPQWSAWLRGHLGEEALEKGAGWALWRMLEGRGGPRFWSPPASSWVAPHAAALVEGRGTPALWEGAAAACEAELATRPAGWLVGGSDGPRALAAELARATRALPAPAAEAIYRAGGRAAGGALRDPGLGRRAPGAETWVWEPAVPPPFRAAFREGLLDRTRPPGARSAGPGAQ